MEKKIYGVLCDVPKVIRPKDHRGKNRYRSIWRGFWNEAIDKLTKSNIDMRHIRSVSIELLLQDTKPEMYSYFIKFYLYRDYSTQENWIEE